MRTLLLHPRPLRTLPMAARRAYATIPTKNPTPSPPIEPSREQAMPMGAFYEAILNTPQPIPDVKPEEPASSVKEAEEAVAKEPAKRGRKPKPKPEPAATATAATAPTSSPAATAKATAKEAAEVASKSSVSTRTTTSPGAGEDGAVAAEAGGAGGAGLSPLSLPSSASSATSQPVLPAAPSPSSTLASTQEKAKVIFGSSLAGPAERAERLARIRSKSTLVAGVMVPPKPDEPDNCCMSGCVNCVWDRFRDEMEEWVVANAEAEKRLAAARAGGEGEALRKGQGSKDVEASDASSNSSQPSPSSSPSISAVERPGPDHTTLSMDDDGGGSEANWDVSSSPAAGNRKIAKDLWDDELYKNVPVGIREFMKQEKRLKEKHTRESTLGK